jgi:hypothetical protein
MTFAASKSVYLGGSGARDCGRHDDLHQVMRSVGDIKDDICRKQIRLSLSYL